MSVFGKTSLINYLSFKQTSYIKIKEFTSVRDELIDNSDVNMIIPMKVPDDTKLIPTVRIIPSMLDKVVHTSSSNLKIQILFDPANSAADVAYQFVISSYVLGPSYNCPSDTFRCWDAATNCIPDSLTCDTIANCHDGSDENGYLCTGRINGIPIPLFAIIITISIVNYSECNPTRKWVFCNHQDTTTTSIQLLSLA
ncbi:uncharacterized protein DC041_0011362 [Schistosoma bovis]|uniref:Uncharacterized protein n=1 Tax=Schistosoma bovis TaxID=6184 RepID=A0A430QU89_SCHBO|nr:uncharacterized protein DC041_0011362 [Schistosoma bovis]